MKRILSIAVSLSVLALLYYRLDLRQLLEVFAAARTGWLVSGFALVIPITLFTAVRLRILCPARLGLGEAARMILAAAALNFILPAKTGEIAKAWFLRQRGYLSGPMALSVVVIEKGLGLLALAAWCLLGRLIVPPADYTEVLFTAGIAGFFVAGVLVLGFPVIGATLLTTAERIAPGKWKRRFTAPRDAWYSLHRYIREDRRRFIVAAALSLFLSFQHITQIWLLIRALTGAVGFVANFAVTPFAMFSGLLPFTFGGVGTRDAAFIFFYSEYFDATTGAVVGLLATARLLLPAIAGLPFVGPLTVDGGNTDE